MTDDLEHVHVGDRVAVGEAALEVVALPLCQLSDRSRLVRSVGVELDLPGVLAVLDLHTGGDHAVSAHHFADGLDHFGTGRGHDDDVPPGRPVLPYQGHCLVENERFNDVVERVLSLIHISEPTRRTPISYAV